MHQRTLWVFHAERFWLTALPLWFVACEGSVVNSTPITTDSRNEVSLADISNDSSADSTTDGTLDSPSDGSFEDSKTETAKCAPNTPIASLCGTERCRVGQKCVSHDGGVSRCEYACTGKQVTPIEDLTDILKKSSGIKTDLCLSPGTYVLKTQPLVIMPSELSIRGLRTEDTIIEGRIEFSGQIKSLTLNGLTLTNGIKIEPSATSIISLQGNHFRSIASNSFATVSLHRSSTGSNVIIVDGNTFQNGGNTPTLYFADANENTCTTWVPGTTPSFSLVVQNNLFQQGNKGIHFSSHCHAVQLTLQNNLFRDMQEAIVYGTSITTSTDRSTLIARYNVAYNVAKPVRFDKSLGQGSEIQQNLFFTEGLPLELPQTQIENVDSGVFGTVVNNLQVNPELDERSPPVPRTCSPVVNQFIEAGKFQAPPADFYGASRKAITNDWGPVQVTP